MGAKSSGGDRSISIARTITVVMRQLRAAIREMQTPAAEKISEEQASTPFHVLVATMLSAQTRDAMTHEASTRLFELPTAVTGCSATSAPALRPRSTVCIGQWPTRLAFQPTLRMNRHEPVSLLVRPLIQVSLASSSVGRLRRHSKMEHWRRSIGSERRRKSQFFSAFQTLRNFRRRRMGRRDSSSSSFAFVS